MPDLISCKFDDEPMKSEYAKLATQFFHYKYMGNIFSAQGQVTPNLKLGSGPNSNSSEI